MKQILKCVSFCTDEKCQHLEGSQQLPITEHREPSFKSLTLKNINDFRVQIRVSSPSPMTQESSSSLRVCHEPDSKRLICHICMFLVFTPFRTRAQN